VDLWAPSSTKEVEAAIIGKAIIFDNEFVAIYVDVVRILCLHFVFFFVFKNEENKKRESNLAVETGKEHSGETAH
jgi:hypothetical protein